MCGRTPKKWKDLRYDDAVCGDALGAATHLDESKNQCYPQHDSLTVSISSVVPFFVEDHSTARHVLAVFEPAPIQDRLMDNKGVKLSDMEPMAKKGNFL